MTKHPRRDFLKHSFPAVILPSTVIPGLLASCQNRDNHGRRPIVIRQSTGEIWYIGNTRKARVTIKHSKNDDPSILTSILHEIIPPRDFIPEHKHSHEDEFIYIERGEANVLVGTESEILMPGDLAYIPKNTWHGLKNEGHDYVHMLFGYSPAGFEDYFRRIGVRKSTENPNLSPSDFEAINKKYGVIYR